MPVPDIVTIETPSLGDRSYVVSDGSVAAVIDPQRDIDRVMRVVDELGVRITHVLETHIHNDYITGGVELARIVGAEYVVAAEDDVAFDRRAVRDGDTVAVGGFVFRVLHTPGHTPTHVSYALERAGTPAAVFTGGSILYGTVGRTDLLGSHLTEPLARAQFRSARRMSAELPPEVTVHPTHGFGSFCSSTATSGHTASTIAQERRLNLALTERDEQRFVRQLLAGLDAYPRYYAQMGPLNRAGPPPVDLSSPPPVDGAELRRRVAADEWVLDLRGREAFATAHIRGTLNLELGNSMATYAGWIIPWGAPITLVGDTPGEVDEARRDLARIGYDRVTGGVSAPVTSLGSGSDLASYRRARFGDLVAARRRPEVVVVDVRRNNEWKEGHVEGAVHIPIHELRDRLQEVPDGEVWVHCASGYRASLGASLLGRDRDGIVLLDDEWATATKTAGLPIVRAA